MRHAAWWALALFLTAGYAAAPAPRTTTSSAPAAVRNPVGGSEYMVPSGSKVMVQSITKVADYCQPPTRKAVQGR